MPIGHVLGMGPQIRAWAKMPIIKLQIQVVRLEIGFDPNAGHRPWEFAKAIINMLGHQDDTLLEFLAIHLGAAPFYSSIAA